MNIENHVLAMHLLMSVRGPAANFRPNLGYVVATKNPRAAAGTVDHPVAPDGTFRQEYFKAIDPTIYTKYRDHIVGKIKAGTGSDVERATGMVDLARGAGAAWAEEPPHPKGFVIDGWMQNLGILAT